MNKLLNPEERKKMISYGKPQGKNNMSPYKNGGLVKTLKTCKCGG
jgi:hypothetical protein